MSDKHPLPRKNGRTIESMRKISVRLDPELHDAAKQRAAAEKLYLMDWVRSLIVKALAKRRVA